MFFRTITLQERQKKAQNISDIWQGNNLTVDGIKKVLSDLGIKSDYKKSQEAPVDEVNKEWRRLASFMPQMK